jgi:hypothetical protein
MPAEPVPEASDNSTRPEDGDQSGVPQDPAVTFSVIGEPSP